MNEKDIKTVVLDEALIKEIVGEEGAPPEGDSRLVRIRPESSDKSSSGSEGEEQS